MDLREVKLKQENSLELEDTNDNYLKFDFEVGVKVENDTPVFGNWCFANSNYQDQEAIPVVYEVVKEECDVQTCFICLEMFGDSSSLYEHNLTHLSVVLTRPKHLYQCDYCLIYCTSKVKIKRHIHAKHFLSLRNQKGLATRTSHQCIICNKVFTYKRWHAHMREVHGTDNLRCGDCNITFKCIRYLRRHMLYKHQNVRPSWRFHNVPKVGAVEEIKCEQCPAVFQNRSSYKAHLRNCHSGEVHECTLCHSKLKSKSYLQAHMKRVHYNDGILYKCDICYKIFKSPRYLNIHKKNTHSVRVWSKRDGRQKHDKVGLSPL